jgi:hypothetical protein
MAIATQKRFNMPQKLKPGMEWMQIAVPVPIKRRLKIEAIRQGITMTELVIKMFDKNLPKE